MRLSISRKTVIGSWNISAGRSLTQLQMTIGIDGEIDGGAVLPGFKLALRDIFSEE
jgi:hypothetical protein